MAETMNAEQRVFIALLKQEGGLAAVAAVLLPTINKIRSEAFKAGQESMRERAARQLKIVSDSIKINGRFEAGAVSALIRQTESIRAIPIESE
ncbi:hypothetical protein U8C35_06290 [Sinorhizobium medicae]|uniref:hypothetical protein n=1 Tax=Sinorhizobium medicae TaxID=110321 RepID=UPI002AF6A9DA|nr:hypothetical protein [Sinorhizobium medicae]WQO60041.1 hypothetical protein U8C35_06290 [Sinorhizobium medicae]